MNNNWCKIIDFNGTVVLVTKEYNDGELKPFAVRFRWEVVDGATVLADVSSAISTKRDELFDEEDYSGILGEMLPNLNKVISDAFEDEEEG